MSRSKGSKPSRDKVRAHRQWAAVAKSRHAREDQKFIDAASSPDQE